ncbi:MAG TPA: hypothetical protein VG410_10140 [Solirubrobacteraceae bacterium]|jgi:hypothetical protein|nr:hypothetical protein [Solirubrobacteraceae bacterium]
MTRYVTILMLAGAVPALAACGSSNSNSASSGASRAAQGIAFAKCMRSHGVPNFPDPSGGGGGGLEVQASDTGSGQSMKVDGVPVNAPAFQSAMRACQSYIPHKAPSGSQLAAIKKNAVRFSACMRSHGVPNFPDPQFRSGPGGGLGVRIGGPGSGLDPKSPAFQAAQKQCGSLIGNKGGGLPAVPVG